MSESYELRGLRHCLTLGLGLALISLPWVASFLSMFNSRPIYILHSEGAGSLDPGVPLLNPRQCPFSPMSPPVTLGLILKNPLSCKGYDFCNIEHVERRNSIDDLRRSLKVKVGKVHQ